MTANTSVGAQPLYERIAEAASDVRSILKHEANALRTPVHRVLLADWDALLREAAEALRNAEKDAARYRWLKLKSKPHEVSPLYQQLADVKKALEVLSSGWTEWDDVIDAALSTA